MRLFFITLLLPLLICAGMLHAREADAPSLRPAGTAEKLGYTPGDSCITIPANIRKLPDYCFAGCRGLRRVTFAEGSQLAQIGDFVFTECVDLEECVLPPGLRRIGDGSFRGCISLRAITLPKGIWEIPREAFAYCRSLDSIALPPGLTVIRPLAFLDCRSLRLDTLPPRVNKIGNNAFGRCHALRHIFIPAGCTELESYAFADCTSLESIVLPAKTEMLGELLFSGCTRLRSITSPRPVPPIIECNSFLFEPDDEKAWRQCRIHVPPGREEAYRLSPFWNRFKHISAEGKR